MSPVFYLPPVQKAQKKDGIKALILTGFGAVLIFEIINFFGRRQFGAFDASALIDVGYRLFLGQKPFHDFFQATPPLFSIVAGYAFKWFGLSWNSLVLISAIWAISCFWLQFWLLIRMGLSLLEAWAISFLFIALSFFPLSYWWYNSVTASSCTLLFTSTLNLLNRNKTEIIDWAAFGTVLTLTSLSKPNAAALCSLSCSLALITSKTHRKKALITIVLSAVASVSVLHVLEVSIAEMITSYLNISGRAFPSGARFAQDQRPGVVLSSILMIVSLCVLFLWLIENSFSKTVFRGKVAALSFLLMAGGFFALDSVTFIVGGTLFLCDSLCESKKKPKVFMGLLGFLAAFYAILYSGIGWFVVVLTGLGVLVSILNRTAFHLPLKIFLGGSFFCAFFCFFTNGEHKTTDLPLLAIPIILLICLNPESGKSKLFGSFKIAVIILLFGVTAIMTATRERVRSAGPFFSTMPLVKVANQNKFFENLHTSKEMISVLGEIRDVLSAEKFPFRKNSVFFGPRLQFAYAAFEVPPPLGLPSWWAPGVTFSEFQSLEMENKLFEADFDVCIFWRKDFTYLSDDFRSRLENAYQKVSDGSVSVYVKKRTENTS